MNGQWTKYKGDVLFGILFAFVLSIIVISIDQIFGPWIFLPEQDSQIKIQIKKLKSTDPSARKEAYDYLVNTKGEKVIKALITLLDITDDNQIRILSKHALRDITSHDFGDNPEVWKHWFEERKRESP